MASRRQSSMGLPIVAILLLVACTSPSAASSSLASLGAPVASPATASAASATTSDPSEAAPAPSVTATTPSRVVVPQGSQPSAACVQAFAAMEAAGGGTLEPSDPVVLKTLTSCKTVDEWRGGLAAVPGAMDYQQASEINDKTFMNDVQVVCRYGKTNSSTPMCVDAGHLGLLA
jgi:hypothetical protein